MPEWVNGFNVYVNFGQAGNYPLNSLSNDLFSTRNQYSANNEIVKAVYISNLANHNLGQEKVTETNYGSEISLFNNRIILSCDYFVKKNSNLLIQRAIPNYYGGGTFYQNIGEMKNKGIEISLELTPITKNDFNFSTRIGYSSNNQYIEKLYDSIPISFNNVDLLYPDFYARENEALGAITGFSYQGKWKDLPQDSLHNMSQPQYFDQMGLAYLKVDTLNRDKLTEKDKKIIGNTIPKFTFNWLTIITYRSFSCEMLWYGSIGVDKYNATKASTFLTGVNKEVQGIIADSLRYLNNNVFYESSYFVEDASFIRLKTLSFAYSPKKKIGSKISMQYKLNFENLITFTHYSGFDPEATIYTNNNFSDNAIDRGAYPSPQSVFLSVNMKF
jgi:hypothetical protein